MWRANLEAASAGLTGLLDATESARAASILDGRRQRRWSHARAILRILLGGYLEVEPADVSLDHAPTGKPSLKRDDSGSGLFFNISHSGPLALFAFTQAGEVGIDVELPRARASDRTALARRALGPTEARRLQALPEDLREREFLRGWVRHEALLKLSGRRDDRPTPWSWLVELEPGGAAAAAVALGRTPAALCCWEWVPGGARPHDC